MMAVCLKQAECLSEERQQIRQPNHLALKVTRKISIVKTIMIHSTLPQRLAFPMPAQKQDMAVYLSLHAKFISKKMNCSISQNNKSRKFRSLGIKIHSVFIVAFRLPLMHRFASFTVPVHINTSSPFRMHNDFLI